MGNNPNIEKLFQKLGLIKASDLLKQKQSEKIKIDNSDSCKHLNPLIETTQPTQVIKNIREKLASLTKHPQRDKEFTEKASNKPTYYETFGGELYQHKGITCLKFMNIYPGTYRYGNIVIGDALNFSAKQAKISSPGLDIPEFDIHNAIFIDTETTSCYGGAGTVAFLIGIGYFNDDNNFCIEQFFMRDFDEELPALHGISKAIENSAILIGYNSKCFDLPLLKNRFLINRMVFPNEDILHFDLIHVARRLWNRRLVDCSLATVEKEILNVRRLGDIPGSLIPKAWLEYISTGKTRLIPIILYHNEKDILSLVGIMAWLAERILIPKGKGFDEINDKLALMRLHLRCKNYREAKETAEHLLEICNSFSARLECWETISIALKKLNLIEERIHALEKWAQETTNSIVPHIELSKIYEHHFRDLDIAMFWVDTALKIEPDNTSLIKRKERILDKIKKRNASLFEEDKI